MLINALEAAKENSPEELEEFMEIVGIASRFRREGMPELLSKLRIAKNIKNVALDYLKQNYFQIGNRLPGIIYTKRPYKKNRGRNGLAVGTYYEKLGDFDIVKFIQDKEKNGDVHWLDVCCGNMVAVKEVMQEIRAKKLFSQVHNFLCFKNKKQKESSIYATGVDLIDYFSNTKLKKIITPYSVECNLNKNIKFSQQTATNLYLEHNFDLITCVSGLQYIEDKLKAIEKWYSLLKKDGLMVVNVCSDYICVSEAEKELGLEDLLSKIKELDFSYTNRYPQPNSIRKNILKIRKNDCELRFGLIIDKYMYDPCEFTNEVLGDTISYYSMQKV